MTRELLLEAALKYNMSPEDVELDYHMTRVLEKLSKRIPDCVFKGGTSLFKCQQLSNRFSQDLDISFSRELSREERKELKDSIVEIASELDMNIKNLYSTKSKRDYNCYLLEYRSLLNMADRKQFNEETGEKGKKEELTNIVKIETALGATCFPLERMKVKCLSADFDFDIQVQTIERTFIDKVFALCDYYIKGRTERLSRHIFDLYQIDEKYRITSAENPDSIKELVNRVRSQRATMWICPSAKEGVNITELLTEMVNKSYYKEDYEIYASEFNNPPVEYDTIIEVLKRIADSELFE